MEFEDQRTAVNRWASDPVLFFEEVLGIKTLEPWQKEAAYAIRDNDRVSIKACHDVGKTWLLARIFLWFFITRKDSIVLTTAPTWAQVEKLLWAEINSAVNKAKFPLGGRCLNTEYKINDKWYAIGLSPRAEVNSGEGQGKTSSFQGFHAPHIMVIFDEATGVRPQVWDLAEGNLTNGEAKFVTIANPTSRSCRFFDTFKDMTWKNLSINCFVSPNFKANKIFDRRSFEIEYAKVRAMSREEALKYLNSYVTVNPYLLSVKWAMQRALKWGLHHPLFVSKVFGDFPLEDDNALIPLSVVEEAQTREVYRGLIRFVGLDCARYGGDDSVLNELMGFKHTRCLTLSKNSVTEVAGEVVKFLREKNNDAIETHIAIDGGAMGGGIIDILRETIKEEGLNWKVYEIQFGAGFDRDNYQKGKAGDEEFEYDKAHYANQKSKMFDLLAADLKGKLSLLDNVLDGMDDVFQAQLPDIQYSINSKSKIVLESKDDYKKRTGKGSPDESDSLALANYARYIKSAKFEMHKQAENKSKKSFESGNEKNKDYTARGIAKFKIKDF